MIKMLMMIIVIMILIPAEPEAPLGVALLRKARHAVAADFSGGRANGHSDGTEHAPTSTCTDE